MIFCILPADAFDDVARLDGTSVPQPCSKQWIDVVRGRKLRPHSIDMLLRTRRHREKLSESAQFLHQSAGILLQFASEEDKRRYLAELKRRPLGARGSDRINQSPQPLWLGELDLTLSK